MIAALNDKVFDLKVVNHSRPPRVGDILQMDLSSNTGCNLQSFKDLEELEQSPNYEAHWINVGPCRDQAELEESVKTVRTGMLPGYSKQSWIRRFRIVSPIHTEIVPAYKEINLEDLQV